MYSYSILSQVEKPGRYVGGEYSLSRLDDSPRVSFCLAYPDVYEVGTSYLGTLILYDLLNKLPGVRCERVFAPWLDMENRLRRESILLSSLESGRPIREFDVVGFSLQHEMDYTNVLNMLDLGGIPLFSKDRRNEDPIIIAGGPSASNPTVLAAYIDAFHVGDSENSLEAITNAFASGKDREGVLLRLADIPGIYVPAVHGKERRVKYQTVDIESIRSPEGLLVPSITPVHDRFTIEVRRGCLRGCRFCHAGFTTRPVRERKATTLVPQIQEGLNAGGQSELGLLSLSTGDYSDLTRLARALSPELARNRTTLSLPSLRADTFDCGLVAALSGGRKLNLTFAPETAGPRMSAVVNKRISVEEICACIEAASTIGVSSVKLYFMVGLPFETDADVEAIPEFVRQIRNKSGGKHRGRLKLGVSISGFVPKPHTPFQWAAQDSWETLLRKASTIKNAVRDPNVQVHYHDPKTSAIEGLLSRGDERVGRVVHEVYRAGGRFDAWSDVFGFENWISACRTVGVGIEEICLRKREKDEVFPWSVIDCGVSREYLWNEYEKAGRGEYTEDCVVGPCTRCGVCSERRKIAIPPEIPPDETPIEETKQTSASDTLDVNPVPSTDQPTTELVLRYEKTGPLAWIGHIDFQRVVHQVFRRAGIDPAYSKGFHPHPRMAFALPLPVGESGLDEIMEISVLGTFDDRDLQRLPGALNGKSPQGLRFTDVRFSTTSKSLPAQVQGVAYRLRLEMDKWEDGLKERLRTTWDNLMGQDNITVTREHRKKGTVQSVDLRPFLRNLQIEKDGQTLVLDLLLDIHNGRTARSEEILEMLFGRKVPKILEVIRSRIILSD